MPRLAITNFSKGEFGPELYGRVDIPQYSSGVKEGLNFLIQRYGGAAFRPGFRFAGEVDDKDTAYRLSAFQYSIDQAYILLHGDEQTRFFAEGGFVVEVDLRIMAATKAAQAVLEITNHEYLVGERLWIDGITGMVELNNRFVTVVAVPDADHITIDVDSTGFTTFVDSSGFIRDDPSPPPTTPPPEAPPPAPPAEPDPVITAPPGVDFDGGGGGSGPGSWREGSRTQLQ